MRELTRVFIWIALLFHGFLCMWLSASLGKQESFATHALLSATGVLCFGCALLIVESESKS